MIKQKKIEEIEKLKENFNRAKVVILTQYIGLNVLEITELRKKLRETDTFYKVVKNTLARRAFTGTDSAGDKFLSELTGPVALAFNFDDPVKLAKVLKDYSREHEKLKIKCGLFNSKFLTSVDINTLANLPSREVLIAKVVSGMKAPINNLVFTLKGIIAKLIYTLEAIKSQKEKVK